MRVQNVQDQGQGHDLLSSSCPRGRGQSYSRTPSLVIISSSNIVIVIILPTCLLEQKCCLIFATIYRVAQKVSHYHYWLVMVALFLGHPVEAIGSCISIDWLMRGWRGCVLRVLQFESDLVACNGERCRCSTDDGSWHRLWKVTYVDWQLSLSRVACVVCRFCCCNTDIDSGYGQIRGVY